MGVIQCEECKYTFSDQCDFCPKCGCPKEDIAPDEDSHTDITNDDAEAEFSEMQEIENNDGNCSHLFLKVIGSVVLTIIIVCVLNSIPSVSYKSSTYKGGVTLENYNKIQEGMTYEQVAYLLGSNGKLISSNTVMGINTQNYSWHTKFGFKIVGVVFQNGRATVKLQKGLE